MIEESSLETAHATEANLVNQFVNSLCSGETCWKELQVVTEWNYRAGFVDILARTSKGSLIAFEAKLTNWKQAFHQAYKNSSYANRVYVLMPRATVHRAYLHRQEFELRGIGLCSIDEGKIRVHIRAKEQKELLSWVRRKAHAHFDGAPNESRCATRSCATLLPNQSISAA